MVLQSERSNVPTSNCLFPAASEAAPEAEASDAAAAPSAAPAEAPAAAAASVSEPNVLDPELKH